jgi:UDP-N-acetylmuramoyl-tripeptide--D-alanyl-D-alanine ligase
LVPFWLEGVFGKEQIYSALTAVAVGKILGMNLVEISQNLKDYKSLPGKMRLIEGINGSFILDDAESATVFSMSEALEILGKIPGFFRKIAVLGDVVGIGKYTIEAHEAIGERVAKNADVLFTFGERAKFIAKGAFEKGMEESKIFSFERVEDGIERLKEEIRKGDLVLVDGSKEMRMSKIVDSIRKIW